MGQEFFLDEGELNFREETIEDEVRGEERGLISSQVINSV